MDMWVIIVLIECTVVCECVWQRVVCLLSQLHALTKFLKEQMMMPQTQKEKKKEAVERERQQQDTTQCDPVLKIQRHSMYLTG